MGLAELREQWGLQAMFDAWAVKGIVGGMDYMVPKTLMPVLRLVSGDPEGTDRAYARVLALREPVRRFDSPRERWRKGYGRFVRELEWVSQELKKHLSEQEYQALVAGAVARSIDEWVGGLKPKFAEMFREDEATAKASADKSPSSAMGGLEKKITRFVSDNMFKYFNAVSFMVGPLEMREMDIKRGYMEAYIPECAMHTVVGTGLPQEEACVVGCKGGTELAFGKDSPMRIELEPHLPGLSCTMRAYWDVEALKAGKVPPQPEHFVPEAQLLKKAARPRSLSQAN
jgi:hypothetical protein